jgi:hypothetical protein
MGVTKRDTTRDFSCTLYMSRLCLRLSARLEKAGLRQMPRHSPAARLLCCKRRHPRSIRKHANAVCHNDQMPSIMPMSLIPYQSHSAWVWAYCDTLPFAFVNGSDRAPGAGTTREGLSSVGRSASSGVPQPPAVCTISCSPGSILPSHQSGSNSSDARVTHDT